MGLSLQVAQTFPARLKLAVGILGRAGAPKQALQSIFLGAMQQLEEVSGTMFDSALKKRVWKKVSNERLKLLKQEFLLIFCNAVLGGFQENEVEEMLES